MLDYIFFLLLF